VSAVYAGSIRHRRFAVRSHEFRHRVAMAYRPIRGEHAEAIRTLVSRTTGSAPAGPIHLLTFGRRFSPVSFYYCYGSGERVDAVVAEVTNTPWGERHAYVLQRTNDRGVLRGEFGKSMHVSPFMGMDQRYVLRLTDPGATIAVHIESYEHGSLVFDATLKLRRAARGRRTSSLRVLGLIYGHALRLRLKGVRLHPHPEVTT
jgi:uncharacterized protein